MTARNRAAQLQPGSVVRWDRLEKAAFAQHPAVFRAATHTRSGHINYWNFVWGAPLAIVYLVCFTAPVWGAAAISVSKFQSYHQPSEERIPLSGTFFILAVFLLIVSIIHWAITRDQFSGLYRVQAGLAFALGGLTWAAIPYWGVRDSVESWHMWLIPAIVATVLGGVFLVLLLIVRDPRAPRASRGSEFVVQDPLPRNLAAQVAQRKERISRLSESELKAITLDLNAAICDLESRKLISAKVAESARGVELGALGVRMPRTRTATKQ